ncbi:MAG: ribokinase [Chloroflexi bacterium]|nr:ribokinase [Chloroflexota bacterium]
MPPDLLVVGHVSQDLTPWGPALGGTASYATLTAARLGLKVAVVTAAQEAPLLPGVTVRCIPSPQTTTMENLYQEGERRQRLLARAVPLGTQHIPTRWRKATTVLLAPLVGEVQSEVASLFSSSLLGLSLQGWLRGWDAQGRIHPQEWPEASQVLPRASLAVVSERDVTSMAVLEEWARLVPVLAVTQGRRGARLHWRGQWHSVLAFPAGEVDPTGAGDVFAAAFLVHYHRTGDALQAAYFASCAASLCVEKVGLEGVPWPDQIEARLRLFPGLLRGQGA